MSHKVIIGLMDLPPELQSKIALSLSLNDLENFCNSHLRLKEIKLDLDFMIYYAKLNCNQVAEYYSQSIKYSRLDSIEILRNLANFRRLDC